MVFAQLPAIGCTGQPNARGRAEPVYDPLTGKLQLVKVDTEGDGRFDAWRYMDGARLVRVEIDGNRDNKVERWEHYGPDQTLEKVGFSLRDDGKEDAWAWAGPDGMTTRVESSARRDGKISRIDVYDKGVLVRAEEDTDGDGRMDKWETYDGSRLAIVAFDTRQRGVPDRRIVYGADSSARVEVDRNGRGDFRPVESTADPADRAVR
jgi:hypothetical protein